MTMNRRAFFQRSAVGLVGVYAGGCTWQSLTALTNGRALPFVTPTAEHYIKNGAEGSINGWREPSLDANAWSMALDGLVDAPGQFDLTWLNSQPQVELVKTMRCVVDSHGAQGLNATALWGGVPLRVLLDAVGLQRSTARRLHLFGADGFTGNLPLERVYEPAPGVPEPIIATTMNGEPLTRGHGGPARLIVPDSFGYACVKWLTRMTATTDESAFGTYQDAGFTDEGRMPVASRVTGPLDNATMPPGLITINGFAVSGFAAISQVEVRVNGGAWQPATIATPSQMRAQSPLLARAIQLQGADPQWPVPGVWVLWSFTMDAGAGDYLLEVRAVDAAGNVQPASDLDIADGVTSIASVRVKVRA